MRPPLPRGTLYCTNISGGINFHSGLLPAPNQ